MRAFKVAAASALAVAGLTMTGCGGADASAETGAGPVTVEITFKDGHQTWNEGCLSFPGVSEDIKRAEYVKVTALDRKGKRFELEADGLLAVAIQHENDHLDGVLMIDKLNAVKRRLMGRKLARANA